MITFQFDGDVDSFELDPVACAPALGENGMAAYRARLDERRALLARSHRNPRPGRCPTGTNGGCWSGTTAGSLCSTMTSRRSSGPTRKTGRSRPGSRTPPKPSRRSARWDWPSTGPAGAWTSARSTKSLQAAEFWCRLLQHHRPAEFLDAWLLTFRRWPSSTTAARLHDAAGPAWPSHREEVFAALASRPADAVLFALLTLTDARLAWDLAHSLNLDDDRTWQELIKAYETIDPLAVLPIHTELVEKDLVQADAQRYRLAARRLVTMRKIAASTCRAADVDALIKEHRETYRRRPRLQQECDRAGLP
jgi:hypothetical protein